MIVAIGLVLIGLIALVAGGDLLVRGAVQLAERAGVTPLMIGIVIVGCGTSLPELVTSVEAALLGSPAIAWGNIAGSNIANSLLILGAVALIAPLRLASRDVLRDPVIGVCAAALLLMVAVFGWAHWALGAALIASLAAYITWCYRQEKIAAPRSVHNAPHDRAEALELTDGGLHRLVTSWWLPLALTLGGLVMLVVGGKLLVSGAIDLSRMAGLSETLVGLTIVAIGTSLPELATSLIAARKGEVEVAFGNVIGSNIYNILGIGGATMLISPGPIPVELMPLDLGLVLGSAALLLVLAAAFRGFGRLAGFGLLLIYTAYLAYRVFTG